MSDSGPVAADEDRPLSGRAWVDSADRFFDWAGDRCNPILIKEARQALKSKHFIWTFGVLLFGAWTWTIIGTMLMMPGIYYAAAGNVMLLGYYWVLAVPMMLVAPMAAHRSLVAEREDGTFEVLSISTLTSYQIIYGKLTSTVLQLIIYFTALVPCVAFTYMLRGVDLPSIALIVTTTFLTAIFLVVIGLFFATLATTRSLQSIMMLLLLGVIILAEYLHGQFAISLLRNGVTGENTESLVLITALGTFYVATSIFLLVAGASSISAASENKSTRLRIMMLVIQALSLFWATFLLLYIQAEGRDYARSIFMDFFPNTRVVIMIFLGLFAMYWMGMGGLMLGESANLSSRVRRGLPRSFLGRVYLTWLNPGPGTGMVFAITNFLGLILWVKIMESNFGNVSFLKTGDTTAVAITIVGYMMFYMGLAHLLVSAVRTQADVSPFIALIAMLLLMSLSCIIPYSAGLYMNNFRNFEWDSSQITNWGWTMQQFIIGADEAHVPWVVLLMGLVSVALNLWYVGRDVMIQRISTPDRVLAELATLEPPRADDESIDPLA